MRPDVAYTEAGCTRRAIDARASVRCLLTSPAESATPATVRPFCLVMPMLNRRLCCVIVLAGLAPFAACGTNDAATGGANDGILLEDASGSGAEVGLPDPGTPDGSDDDATGEDDGGIIPDPIDAGGGPDPGPVDAGGLDPDGEQECADGIDNDRDGIVDCGDLDCLDTTECEGLAPSEFSCVDGIDNDGNGQADCDDENCQRSPVCREDIVEPDAGPPEDVVEPPPIDAGPPADAGGRPDTGGGGGLPGIPFEFNCDDSIDNDADGQVDCDDDNCDLIPPCGGGGGGIPPIPFEWQCGDGVDNDVDGSVDCADGDCRFIPPCLGR
jgi:hypothetical protein